MDQNKATQNKEIGFGKERRKTTDRRRYKRVSVTASFIEPIQIAIDKNQKTIPGIILDINYIGMSFIIYSEIPIGKKVTLSFSFEGLKNYTIKGKVHNLTKKHDIYRIVILFDEAEPNLFKNIENLLEDVCNKYAEQRD